MTNEQAARLEHLGFTRPCGACGGRGYCGDACKYCHGRGYVITPMGEALVQLMLDAISDQYVKDLREALRL